MSHLDRESPTSIYHQLAARLRRQILSSELKPGVRLSPELEIAEENGISRGTVRQAMNILVSEGLVERTAGKGTFVRRLGRPKSQRGLIGLVVPYARDSLTMDILIGTESAAKSQGYSLIFSFTNDNLEQEAQDIRRMRSDQVSGLIIFPISNISDDESIRRLHAEKFPFVLIDRYLPDLLTDYVVTDNMGGAYHATEHLINLGYKTIGFISTSRIQTTSVNDRFWGYRRALADYGLVYQNSWQCVPSVSQTGRQIDTQYIHDFLCQPDRPRALFAVNDDTAFHVANAADAEGVIIPNDLALVGFDDIELAAKFNVPLTTVAQPRHEIGMRAAHLLIDKIEGTQTTPSQIVLPTTLVVRQSCGARRKLMNK